MQLTHCHLTAEKAKKGIETLFAAEGKAKIEDSKTKARSRKNKGDSKTLWRIKYSSSWNGNSEEYGERNSTQIFLKNMSN